MNSFLTILLFVTLPWSQMFRQDFSLNEEMTWAAMDISGLDVNFNDGFRAGLWGLTPTIARSYGLRVDDLVDNRVDERFDVKRSSFAAARYMKDLLAKYDNDSSRALLAFVNTPFRQVGDNRWITPGRTPRVVSKEKLAALTNAFNITEEVRAASIAATDNTDRAQDAADAFQMAMAKLEQRSSQEKPVVSQPAVSKESQPVSAQDDDPLSFLYSDRFNSRSSQPVSSKSSQSASSKSNQSAGSKSNQSAGSNGSVHVVKNGETLSHIAKKYGCTVNQIKEWNGLKSDVIQIGQKLKIKK